MRNTEEFSLAAFSKVVEAIYDCVLEPERWGQTVRLVAELSESPIGALGIQDLKNSQIARVFDHGYPPSYVERYAKYAHLNPIFINIPLVGIGEAFTRSMICEDVEFFEGRFYRECVKPFGLGDAIGFVALRSGSRVAFLAATRTELEPRYGERELRLFKLLAPHVCRALQISDALDLRTLTSHMLEATLSRLAAGVYLVARDGRVVHMNAAAEHQIKTGNALRIINNRLAPTHRVAGATLAKVIAGAAVDEGHQPPGGHALALPDPDGGGLVATVLPLDRGNRRGMFAPFAAAVAVFVQDSAVVPQFPGEAFAKLYGLTGGELRVLLAMAPGLGVKEAADMLGISETTAKTHLQRIFSKTSTSKQTELMNLLRASTPPIRAA